MAEGRLFLDLEPVDLPFIPTVASHRFGAWLWQHCFKLRVQWNNGGLPCRRSCINRRPDLLHHVIEDLAKLARRCDPVLRNCHECRGLVVVSWALGPGPSIWWQRRSTGCSETRLKRHRGEKKQVGELSKAQGIRRPPSRFGLGPRSRWRASAERRQASAGMLALGLNRDARLGEDNLRRGRDGCLGASRRGGRWDERTYIGRMGPVESLQERPALHDRTSSTTTSSAAAPVPPLCSVCRRCDMGTRAVR